MAVIINELEIVLDPDANTQKADTQKTNGAGQDAEKPPLQPQDLVALLDREQRNRVRVMAH